MEWRIIKLRFIKMFRATLVLLLCLLMLANGQQGNVDLNEEHNDDETVSGKDDDVVDDNDADGDGGTPDANTNATSATTVVTSPSTSTTSGSSTIFSTKTLVFSIMLSVKFFSA